MAEGSIFEYSDYKRFLLDWMAKAPQAGRGMRKALAEAVGCQTPYITHVLSGTYHFSLEQAEAAARWLGLGDRETEFFLLLVMHQRAGTKTLERVFSRQLSRRREQQTVLKKRIGIKESLGFEDQLTYYSDWIYAALHMAVLNPTLRTAEALREKFRMSRTQVNKALDFLVNRGLIARDKNSLKILKPGLHLERDSPLLPNHHMQWRLRAIDAVKTQPIQGLHYSGVISLSKEDYEFVRERLAQLLEQVGNRVKNSEDQVLACLSFDWFEL